MNQYEMQAVLETVYDKNQLMPRLKDIASDVDPKGMDPEFAKALIAQMLLHKRADPTTLVGLLLPFGTAQEVATLLEQAAHLDLVDFDGQRFITRYLVPPEIQRELDIYQYPVPMIVKPLEVRNNFTTGYLNEIPRSILLKNNYHTEDVCLDHINRVNQIPLTVNTQVVSFVKNKWKNLDKPKADETLEKYRKRVRAFVKYDHHAHHILNLLENQGNKFYLTHAYDKRGRSYCKGYYINYQGNPWNKAVVEFHNKEIV